MLGWWKRRKARKTLDALKDNDDIAAPSIASVSNDGIMSVVLDRPGVTFVFCWAAWCQPCHRMGAVVEQVANEMTHVLFVKLNVEDAAETALQYNVTGTPTFLLFQDGKLRTSRFGSLSAKKLKIWIRESIGRAPP